MKRTTQAPWPASRRAVAAPMRLLAPVTRATVPVSLDVKSGAVNREVAGQVAVSMGLGEQGR